MVVKRKSRLDSPGGTRFRFPFAMALAFLVVAFGTVPGTIYGADMTMVYGGRLVTSTGAPISGPLHLQVRFFHQATGGSPVGNIALVFQEVPFVDGMFQLELKLTEAEWHQVLPNVNTPVFIEIENMTYGGKFPRQQYNIVPYAMKVPVDNKSIAYDASGRLSLNVAPPAANGHLLSSTTSGELSWVAPPTGGGNAAFTSVTASNAGISVQDNDGTTNTITLRAPTNLTANQTYILPGAADAGKFLQTDAAGNLTWATMAAGMSDLNTDIYFNGASSRAFYIDRHPMVNNAGQDLLLTAGGATIGATDKNGGGLVLSAGTATGSGSSAITFKTASSGGAGTNDRTPTTKMTITGDGAVGIGTATPTQLLEVAGNAKALKLNAGLGDAVAFGGGDFSVAAKNGVQVLQGAPTDDLRIRMVNHDNTLQLSYWNYEQSSDSIMLGSKVGSPIRFMIGGERMRIDHNGNVGIGTTTPAYALDVSGTVRASSFISTSGASDWSNQALNNIASLSIGTSSVGTDLFFGGSAHREISVGTNTVSGSNLTVRAGATTGSNQNGGDLILSSGTANGSGFGSKIEFKTASGGAPVTSMVISDAGKVGIGTSTPTFMVDAIGNGGRFRNNTAGEALYVQGTYGGTAVAGQPTLGVYNLSGLAGSPASTTFFNQNSSLANISSAAVEGGLSGTTPGSEAGFLRFATRNGGSISEKMRINAAGNMGIGTSNPSAAISIYRSGVDLPALRLEDGDITIPDYSNLGINPVLSPTTVGGWSSSTSVSGGMAFNGFTSNTSAAYPLAFTGYHGSTSPTTAAVSFAARKHDGGTNATGLAANEKAFSFFNNTISSGTELLTVLAGGNVGIGSTSPSYALTVNKASPTADEKLLVVQNTGVDKFTVDEDGDVVAQSIFFNGQTYGGLYSDSAGHLYFGSGQGIGFEQISGLVAGAGKTAFDFGHYADRGIGTDQNFMRLDYRINSGNANSYGLLIEEDPGYGTSPIGKLFGANYNGQSRFVIQSDGKVGIGTSSPSALLSIERDDLSGSAGSGPALWIKNTNATDPAGAGYNIAWSNFTAGNGAVLAQFGANYGVGTTSPWSLGSGFYITTRTDHPIILGTGSTWTEKMRVTNSGNVGIGTSAPNTTLDVSGHTTIRGASDLRLSDSDNSNYIGFKAPSTVASNKVWELPASGEAIGKVLAIADATTGTLTWSDAATDTNTKTLCGDGEYLSGDATTTCRTAAQIISDGSGLLSSAVGVSVQGYDATLAGIAATTPSANELLYSTGADTFATTTLTAAARGLLDDTSTAAMATTLGAGAASGLATLDSGSKVVQDPANATATPTANKIIMAGAGGTLSLGWLPATLTGKDADTVDGIEGSSIVQTARTISAGTGLSGGGNLSADRTIALDINGLTAETSADDADLIPIYDASGTAIRKMTRANFLSGLPVGNTLNASDGNPTSAVYVDAEGEVGIGTNSPAYLLDVNGTSGSTTAVRIRRAANTDKADLIFGPDGALSPTNVQYNIGLDGTMSSFQIRRWDGVTTVRDFTIDTTGYVGIGTHLPSSLLHVNGGTVTVDSGTGAGTISLQTQTGTWAGNLLYKAPDTNANMTSFGSVRVETPDRTDGTETGKMVLRVLNSGTNVDQLTVAGTGVGIGSESPFHKLEIRGQALNQYGLSTSTDSAGRGIEIVGQDYVGGSVGSSLTLNLGTGSGTTYATIAASTLGKSAAGVLSLNPVGGYVGIGTTTSDKPLMVSGASGEVQPLRLHRQNGSNGAVIGMLYSAQDSGATVQSYAATSGVIESSTAGAEAGAFTISTVSAGASSEKVRVTSTGNVGIGTPGPSAKLHVSGGQVAVAMPATLTPSGTTQTIDWDTGNIQTLNLASATGNVTVSFSNPVAGANYAIKIVQGATARTITWPAGTKWPGGTPLTLSTSNGAVDLVTLFYDGTSYYAVGGVNFQ